MRDPRIELSDLEPASNGIMGNVCLNFADKDGPYKFQGHCDLSLIRIRFSVILENFVKCVKRVCLILIHLIGWVCWIVVGP